MSPSLKWEEGRRPVLHSSRILIAESSAASPLLFSEKLMVRIIGWTMIGVASWDTSSLYPGLSSLKRDCLIRFIRNLKA
jgi:hypothetical protein